MVESNNDNSESEREKLIWIIEDIEKRIGECEIGLAIVLRSDEEVRAFTEEERVQYWGQIIDSPYYQRLLAHAGDLDSIYDRFPELKPKETYENPPGAW